MVSKDTWVLIATSALDHLGLRELGHRLGALGHGVLRELTGQDKANRRLDVTAAHRHALVDAAQLGRLRGDLLERIRPNSEVKRRKARPVLGWGTAWEALRVPLAFYILAYVMVLRSYLTEV